MGIVFSLSRFANLFGASATLTCLLALRQKSNMAAWAALFFQNELLAASAGNTKGLRAEFQGVKGVELNSEGFMSQHFPAKIRIEEKDLVISQNWLGAAAWGFDLDKLEDWVSSHLWLKRARDLFGGIDLKAQAIWRSEYRGQGYGWSSGESGAVALDFSNASGIHFLRHEIFGKAI